VSFPIDGLLDEVLRLHLELVDRDEKIEQLQTKLNDVEHLCIIGRANRSRRVRDFADLLLRVVQQ
jgi:ATP:corrinoid adenosyltransferase